MVVYFVVCRMSTVEQHLFLLQYCVDAESKIIWYTLIAGEPEEVCAHVCSNVYFIFHLFHVELRYSVCAVFVKIQKQYRCSRVDHALRTQNALHDSGFVLLCTFGW